jgi:hypothetical protein
MVHMLRLILFAVMPALAHDLYLMPETFRPRPGQTIEVAFHNGDAFPQSESGVAVSRLRDTNLRGRTETVPLTNLQETRQKTTAQVRVNKEGCLLLTGRTLPRRIELAPEKFESYLKGEGLGEVIDWRKANGESSKPGRERYSKYVKSLLQSGPCDEYYQSVVGFVIEIIPEQNPYGKRPGSQLPIQILFRGRPAAGLKVEVSVFANGRTSTQAAGVSDSHGRVQVPLAASGIYRLHVIKMERREAPEIDWESFWATLTFEVP